jgi:hypothetical protein
LHRSVLAVQESVLILALLEYLAHKLLILLQLVVLEKDRECLVLLEDQALSDHLNELLEREIEGYQVPIIG